MTRRENLEQFCSNWFEKAATYRMVGLSDYFDKFITIYVVFNRVYIEAARILYRERPNEIPLKYRLRGRSRSWLQRDGLSRDAAGQHSVSHPNPTLPVRNELAGDRACATELVVVYSGKAELQEALRDSCRDSITQLVHLILHGLIHFHENPWTGMPDTGKDRELANEAMGFDPGAILTLIYQTRCNMFHGEKGFEEVQHQVLTSEITILDFTTRLVLARVMTDLARLAL